MSTTADDSRFYKSASLALDALLRFDDFFDCCTVLLLTRLAKIDRIWRESVQNYMRKKWNIHIMLACYFDDPAKIYDAFARGDGLICGSSALNLILERDTSTVALDVFVSTRHFDAIRARLDAERYIRVGTESPLVGADSEGFGLHVHTRHKYVKDTLTIFVFLSRRSPVSCVLACPLTCGMNMVTAEQVICVYPRALLCRRMSLLLRTGYNGPADYDKAMVEKYHSRGIHMRRKWKGRVKELFPQGRRWLGDKFCWIVDSTPASNTVPSRQEAIFQNGWSFGVSSGLIEHRFDYVIDPMGPEPRAQMRESVNPFWVNFARPVDDHYTRAWPLAMSSRASVNT